MTWSLLIANVWSWALQVLLLMTVTAATLALLSVSDPRLRLRTWHGALAVSLLLPLVERWQTVTPWESTPNFAAGAVTQLDWQPWLAGMLVLVVVLRTVGLARGLVKLRGLRTGSESWQPLPVWYSQMTATLGTSASLRVSRQIKSAVTFRLSPLDRPPFVRLRRPRLRHLRRRRSSEAAMTRDFSRTRPGCASRPGHPGRLPARSREGSLKKS